MRALGHVKVSLTKRQEQYVEQKVALRVLVWVILGYKSGFEALWMGLE